MRAAIGLARRGLGRTWPNPSVGCILTRDGRVVGRGWTQPGGRPHAETQALDRAGAGAAGATAYVTLEPCAHRGGTPPCAEALVAAGIGRCVVAIEDPDPRVSGRGLAALRDAGVAVAVGVEAEAARDVTAGFLSRVERGRPLITLKLATSLDGRIATHGGDSRWITGDLARHRTHLLRAEHDAVMIGAATAAIDDPMLTCRVAGLEDRSPVRVIADPRLRLPLTAAVVRTARETPTWLLTLDEDGADRRRAFVEAGVEVLAFTAEDAGKLPLGRAMAALGERGLTRLLVEGGGRLAASLLGHGLVDRLYWFHAPVAIGGDGVPGLAAMGIDGLGDAPRFLASLQESLGEDHLSVLCPAAPGECR